MNKSLLLFAMICILPAFHARAEAIASSEDEAVNYTQPVQEQEPQIGVHLDLANMVDTGVEFSQAAIAPENVADNDGSVPGPQCHQYKTRASFYSSGRLTSTGERFNKNGLTAATLNLPLGSTIYVKMPGHSKWVKGRANDHGPYVRGRGMDLALGYARAIGFPLGRGVATVQVAACGRDGGRIFAARHRRHKG